MPLASPVARREAYLSQAHDPATKAHEAFDRKVRAKDMLGYWMIPNRSDGYREPEPEYGPYLWHWRDMREILDEAVDNVPKSEAHRRFIGFQHPDIKMGTTPNLMLGAQMLMPGEEAPCHRHTMDAVRFVVAGDGITATVVEGEQFAMTRGDLITTPNWSWHDHVSGGPSETIWLDGAVAPLTTHFRIGFAEPHQAPQQTVSRPKGWSAAQFGPVRAKYPDHSTTAFRPPYRYPWADTRAALDMLAEGDGDPHEAVTVTFADPVTGGPTLPTVDCEMTLLRAGEVTQAHRHTAAAVYHAFEGAGAAVIGDRRIEWQQGDTFVVPSWSWHAFENRSGSPALLFSINDEPVMRALGFWREEQAG
ncbi:MAG: cupin domain-containing protein [Alphaproteobacteria bacterium]|nr:cupin domain-containing protein [Alphaproteobacteria bacterium]